MTLEAQIQLITVPQEFTRLCNAILEAKHGDDFLVIDDDQADRGNDGYLKSSKTLFAMHCFKRVQNQSLDSEIRRKMIGDLGKAIALKDEGIWAINSWVFLSNYPVSEAVAERVVQRGRDANIEVGWRGPDYLARSLQAHPEIQELFPALQINSISQRLKELTSSVQGPDSVDPSTVGSRVPRSVPEKEAVARERPDGWEYLLFGGALYIGKDNLERKWHDFEIPPHRRIRQIVDVSEASQFLTGEMNEIIGLTEALERVFSPEVQEQAFGPPGVEGDPHRIEHLANRVISTYAGILDWAAEVRQVRPPEILAPAFEMVPLMADRPLRKFRGFVDDAVAKLDRVPAILQQDEPEEPIVLTLDLHLELDADVMAEYHRRIKRAQRKQRWGF
ncbi:MAG TPA: hypothetical protein VFY48_03230 [Solirubrobacterales bacterium]|nr:hypothetical protein [Solirubrobacterales bacterium]